MAGTVMIGLDAVTKSYPGEDHPAVDRLTFEVEEGEIVALVGPSGCGKTTTLKMINRLIEPTSGIITVGGRDVTSMPPPMLRSMFFQILMLKAEPGLRPERQAWMGGPPAARCSVITGRSGRSLMPGRDPMPIPNPIS